MDLREDITDIARASVEVRVLEIKGRFNLTADLGGLQEPGKRYVVGVGSSLGEAADALRESMRLIREPLGPS